MQSPAPPPGQDSSSTAIAAPAGPVFFDAVLRPNTSLSRRGFALLMALLAVLASALSILFWQLGAWPIFGFLGLECGAVYWLFRMHYRAQTRYETIRLDRERLTLRRVDAAGRAQEVRIEPSWLQVRIDEPVRHDSQLVLMSHGRGVVAASFLSPEERADLAKALRRALAAWRDRGWQAAG